MFEKLIKELERLNGSQIAIPIEADEEGYLDKECPDTDCMFQFKVLEEDWKTIFNDEAVHCPMCCKQSKSNTFFTTEQVENARQQGHEYLSSQVHNALKEDAKAFNRRQPRNGFLTMSMSIKGNKPIKLIMPIPARENFEQKIQCKECNARYSIIGSAFFCPSCGHNSVEQTFDNSINRIINSIQHIPTIRTSLTPISKDDAEDTCRNLIEKGLVDCVVAFQRFCDVYYLKNSGTNTKMPPNAFQKLDVGEELWKNVFGESYSSWLNPTQMQRLLVLFQRRHLLQHTEGIIDQKYLDKSKDTKYVVGQRVVVKEEDVIELAEYIKALASVIRSKGNDAS